MPSLSASTRDPDAGDPQLHKQNGRGLTGLLLLCGLGAVAVTFLADVVASASYEGYSYTAHTLSELSAVDAPTRALSLAFSFVYNLLWLACAAGIWRAAGNNRSLRVVAGCVALLGLLGLLVWPFAPIHQREAVVAGETGFSDTLHVVLISVNMLLFFVATTVGLRAFGPRFRLYTIATLVIVVVFGVVALSQSARIDDGDATPGLGITERLAVYGSLLWPAMAGLALHRA